MRFQKLHFQLLFISILLVFSACRKEPLEVKEGDQLEFSSEEQSKLGEEITNEIFSNPTTYPILDRNEYPEAYKYLQDSILNVAVNTGVVTRREDFDWKVNIVHNDDDRNAFIVPGGELFIYTGLLKFLDNNAELMGVVAHEIAYADSEWLIENLIDRFEGSNLRDIVEGKDFSELDNIADYFQTIRYNDPAVIHADTFAVNLLCPFNYDPAGLKDLIVRADSITTGDFKWLTAKIYGVPNRVKLIDDMLEKHDCTSGSNVQLKSRYDRLKDEYLP